MTLIELLAVIAIMGVLMGMILPAVQSAREAARRTACANNVKQIGVALSGFEATAGRYPPGVGSYVWQSTNRLPGAIDDAPEFGFYQWTYFLHILLPRLDEQQYFDALGGPLFRKQDFVMMAAWTAQRDWAVVSRTPLPQLLCPSDGQAGSNWWPRAVASGASMRPWAFNADDVRLAKSNYLGFFSGTTVGQALDFVRSPGSDPRQKRVAPLPTRISQAANAANPALPLCERGIFGFEMGTPLQAVKDGASFTIAVGEYLRGVSDVDGRGMFWLNHAGMQMLQARTTPNSRTPDRLYNPQGVTANLPNDPTVINATDYGCYTISGVVRSPNNRPDLNLPCVGGDSAQDRWVGFDSFAGTRSRHRGGVNVLFVDGRVSFINDTIDGSTAPPYGTWQRLVWIDDGNEVGEW